MKSWLTICSTVTLIAFPLFSCYSRSDSQSNLAPTIESVTKGKVIKIVDGDTYSLLTGNNIPVKVRMAGIDAPEKKQPYYQKAKDFLGQLCFNKVVTIKIIDKDRHGRIVAETQLDDGRSLSHEMVKNGYAWHFKKYSSDETLSRLEQQAKINKAGLWADDQPIAPWEYRALRKNKGRAPVR